jgi:hypothetical protein
MKNLSQESGSLDRYLNTESPEYKAGVPTSSFILFSCLYLFLFFVIFSYFFLSTFSCDFTFQMCANIHSSLSKSMVP